MATNATHPERPRKRIRVELTEGEEINFVAGQTVGEILADPDLFYVNVHNAE